MNPRLSCWIGVAAVLFRGGPADALPIPMPAPGQDAPAAPQQAGTIRGVVTDKDFDTPLGGATVTAVELDQKVMTNDEGNFVFGQLPPGKYTLVFSKEGYVRQVMANVVVTTGQLTDLDASLSGEFTEMDEFVVQDIQLGGGEAVLLKLRLDSPQLMDSISADLMSKAGASDAAGALSLVAGASVQDGKYAVIRGLPDRYVSSQLNGVRLPSADEDKRAVQLDQFPAAVIDSIQVSKTFTPDQQGDASGGAVNVMLKGIPDEASVAVKFQFSENSQVHGSNFLTYDGGSRKIQDNNIGSSWTGDVGVSEGQAPLQYKWSVSGGGSHEFDNGIKVGGFASFFYEQDASFFDNGIDDSYWVTTPGGPMVPETIQGTPADGDFKTKLFDITQGTKSTQWGGLGTAGVEIENHLVNVAYLYTKSTDDQATLAVDTRGKNYFFPDYNPNDPAAPGNAPTNLHAAPYIRTETLTYTERTVQSIMLNGKHTFPIGDPALGTVFKLGAPELDWIVSANSSDLNQPDKRQFGALWLPKSLNPGFPPFIPAFTTPAVWLPFKPAANFTLGNLQRIWKEINETDQQYALNLKLPFEQWSQDKGYVKMGLFDDKLKRDFNQDTFSNFGDNSFHPGGFDDPWSPVFPSEVHPITPANVDVDYKGDQKIAAGYVMADVPLCSFFNVIGGVRWESTDLSIVNIPEPDATWFPPGSLAPVTLNPGDADVAFSQDDVLPSIGFVLKPIEKVTFRGSYAKTVARQTFKELTPVIQQEFLGGPIFIGNPDLLMSEVTNYDLRLDYTPNEGGLLSVSWFQKDITLPIEYVQRIAGFTFTTPVNYPQGTLSGFEFEARQEIGNLWDKLEGLSLGLNATFINSEVTLPADEAAGFEAPNIQAPMPSRDMTGAPNHLYNIYATYNIESTGTELGLFYTVTGDTLIAGAAESQGNFVPNIYATQYGTLNFTATQKLGKYFKVYFQAKNLTNPELQTVYRSKFIGGDVVNTSSTAGIDYTVGLSAQFTF